MKILSSISLLLTLCLLTQKISAQEIIHVEQSCTFDGTPAKRNYVLNPSTLEAQKVVDNIINILNIFDSRIYQNFILNASDCNKAIAIYSKGERYILYNPDFLYNEDAWCVYGVFTHLILHFVQKDLSIWPNVDDRKEIELEADRISGVILRSLGASYEEAEICIENFYGNNNNKVYPQTKARKNSFLGYWSVQWGNMGGLDKIDPTIQKTSSEDQSMANFLKARFPFPPPECHTSYELPVNTFLDCRSLGDVGDKITKALEAKKYSYRYRSVPDGFAIVTRMEQYQEDGSVFKNDKRWKETPTNESFSWSLDYLNALMFPKKCYLRIFVFLVTNQNFSTDNNLKVNKEAAAAWHSDGVNRLPYQITVMPFEMNYRVSLLLYEFEVPESNHKPKQNCPTRYPALEHLERSGLGEYLR